MSQKPLSDLYMNAATDNVAHLLLHEHLLLLLLLQSILLLNHQLPLLLLLLQAKGHLPLQLPSRAPWSGAYS